MPAEIDPLRPAPAGPPPPDAAGIAEAKVRERPRHLPPPIRTDGSNAFAYHTMAVRVPAIIEETVARNPDYSPSIKEAFTRLHDEIIGDAPLRLFEPPAPDFDLWASSFAPRAGESWLRSQWFFCEILAYRLMLEAGQYWSTLRDPFAPFKEEEMASDDLWNVLETALAMGGTLEERLAATLTATLWGNRIDLSIKHSVALGTSAQEDHLLADNVAPAVRFLLGAEPGTVHLVMDNAGTEQALNFVLADRLLTEGVARTVTLHVKMQPVLVSDVIVSDVHELIRRMAGRGGDAAALARRLREHLAAGRLSVVPDFFWTTPAWLWELPSQLYEPLRGARLVVFKGDANYRRATHDASWPMGMTLADAVYGFPAPVLVLRTLKSDALVGLEEVLIGRMDETAEADWRTCGVYGVAQFAP